MNERREPPRHVWYDLDEAIDLLAVLQDAQLTALDTGALSLVIMLEHQIELLHLSWISASQGERMPDDTAAHEAHGLGALTMAEAARRLGVPTREIVDAVIQRQIRFIMVRGIAHIPEDALEEYPAKAS